MLLSVVSNPLVECNTFIKFFLVIGVILLTAITCSNSPFNILKFARVIAVFEFSNATMVFILSC